MIIVNEYAKLFLTTNAHCFNLYLPLFLCFDNDTNAEKNLPYGDRICLAMEIREDNCLYNLITLIIALPFLTKLKCFIFLMPLSRAIAGTLIAGGGGGVYSYSLEINLG